MLKRTALYDDHKKLGGRLIDFGGWELPVQYSGIADEHLACRSAAGLFDVSHMGEVLVHGQSAEAYLNFLITQDISRCAVGQAMYTTMCYETGGIVDDLVIYRLTTDRFLVIMNASNTEKDYQHMIDIKDQFQSRWQDLQITNESAHYSQIAIQGRKAQSILSKLTKAPLSSLKTYWFLEGTLLGSVPALIGRTGYTGEDGFEIYTAWNDGSKVWNALIESGTPEGLKPCGLGARDTLRLEMKYPLYGNELSDQTNPLEAGLGWVVKLNKSEFMGRDSILKAKEQGLKRKLVGLKMIGRGIPRHGYTVHAPDLDETIGEITSGAPSPCLKESIGIAYIDEAYSQIGSQIAVDIRGAKILAEIVQTPFYKRDY